jgi:hypothetical protein
MFTNKDSIKFDAIMDSIKSFGEKIGNKVHISGAWVIKAMVMGVAILVIGGSILIVSVARKAFGKKD